MDELYGPHVGGNPLRNCTRSRQSHSGLPHVPDDSRRAEAARLPRPLLGASGRDCGRRGEARLPAPTLALSPVAVLVAVGEPAAGLVQSDAPAGRLLAALAACGRYHHLSRSTLSVVLRRT